jgi:hypothetical protein
MRILRKLRKLALRLRCHNTRIRRIRSFRIRRGCFRSLLSSRPAVRIASSQPIGSGPSRTAGASLPNGASRRSGSGTSKDLFGLFPVPENPHPSFSRLSRYEHTGLIWLLHGCPVIALTEATAARQHPSGAITIYRKHNKPALGPAGDSLDDLE